jgi:formylglycine-generating enzyme required for sulfatase activity
VLGIILFLLLFMSLRMLHRLPPASSLPLPPNLNIAERLKDVDRLTQSGKLCSPPGSNALSLVRVLHDLDPGRKDVRKKLNTTIREVRDKMDLHRKRLEFEPAFLTARSGYRITGLPVFRRAMERFRRRLIRPAPLRFRDIPGGTFPMGDFETSSEIAPVHNVTLSAFQMSETPVTNQQYCDFLNEVGLENEGGVDWLKLDSPYALIEKRDGRFVPKYPYDSFPVIEVSWFGAQRFCEWAGGRLPTEAEWEYAARAGGKPFVYATGSVPDKLRMNYLADPNDALWHSLTTVMNYPKNRLGLYEMSGNLLEWCRDFFEPDYYVHSPQNDPPGPYGGSLKVVRGGAWCYPVEHAKTFYRGSAKPSSRNNFIGFRIVREGRHP